ncbi:photosynthetic complex assembly protein PuhC [Algihabitans albus]|uniref:photosynthetic complex assembly protein PuhC n=1 Tax=Algihabitans albus TaxID=2164067 RepID=UPI000E5D2AB2|nr:photosynthetic complex assembly protein PuhC [Algihabitans albus]
MTAQTDHLHHPKPFPKGMLWAAAALISFSIAIALIGRMTDFGTVRNPEASPRAAYDLIFADRVDGSVSIASAETGQPVIALDPGTNGFARGVMRGLARDRKLERIGRDVPFRLTSWSDGRLTLEDLATGREVEVNAFGPTQIETFVKIMEAAGRKAAAEASAGARSQTAAPTVGRETVE